MLDRRSVGQSVIVSNPMWGPRPNSSLTRGWVCRLQLLLGLASTVIFRSQSRGTHDHSYCLRFETSATWRPRSPSIYIPQEHSGLVISPGTGSLFFSSYNSQGYSGGIRTRLYVGLNTTATWFWL
jgi:hypothetical protein